MTEPTPDNASAEAPAPIVPPVAPADGGWQADFPAGLRSMGGVLHGGAVVAAMADAAAQAAGRNVSAVSAHLHLGVEPGPAEIRLTELAAGRTSTTTRAELVQGRLRASATILLTADAAAPDLPVTVAETSRGAIPPAPDRSFVPEPTTGGVGWVQSLDLQRVGDARPFSGAAEALVQGWVRPRTPTPRTAAGAIMLLDAMIPTLMVVRTTPALIFTIEYTVHLTPAAHLPRPADQWLFMRQHTVWAIGDLSVDDAELWTDDGRLLGTARQMRRTMPMPSGS